MHAIVPHKQSEGYPQQMLHLLLEHSTQWWMSTAHGECCTSVDVALPQWKLAPQVDAIAFEDAATLQSRIEHRYSAAMSF